MMVVEKGRWILDLFWILHNRLDMRDERKKSILDNL
jgi:hypothetical protein